MKRMKIPLVHVSGHGRQDRPLGAPSPEATALLLCQMLSRLPTLIDTHGFSLLNKDVEVQVSKIAGKRYVNAG